MIYHPINIHPLIVHFPIALLTTYVVLEVFRFEIITRWPFYFYLKAVLLILGTLSGGAAILAGKMAEDLIHDRTLRPVIEKHQFFALLSMFIFGLLTLYYLWAWYRQQTLSTHKIVILLSLLGLVSIIITGALGGSIVYGPTNDPITKWIYSLFF